MQVNLTQEQFDLIQNFLDAEGNALIEFCEKKYFNADEIFHAFDLHKDHMGD